MLAVCAVLSVLFFPDSPFVFEECQAIMTPMPKSTDKKKKRPLVKPTLLSRPSVFMTSKKVNLLREQLMKNAGRNKHHLSMFAQLSSPEFLFTLLLFLVCSFWFNFFLGTLQMRTADIFGQERSYYYVRLFTAIYPFSALLNPAVGSVTE